MMPIDPLVLSSIASDYAKDMTSIRGRRVQRLIKREFGGADCVAIADIGLGVPAVVGVSAIGVAFCATNGKGKYPSVIKWRHGAAEALETQFDLLKDSLPALGPDVVVPSPAISSQAQTLISTALGSLT